MNRNTSAQPIGYHTGLPDDLQSLWNLLDNIAANPNVANLDVFSTSMAEAGWHYDGTEDLELKAQVAQLSIYKLAIQLKRTDKSYVTTRMVTSIITPLSDPIILERVKATPDNLPVVVCAILIAAYKNLDARTDTIESSKTVDLILGTNVPPDILNNPAALISLFYGPGVWELYSLDVSNASDLPKHLLNNKVPLHGLTANHTDNQYTPHINIPGDIL